MYVSTETLGFNCCKHNRDIENFGSLSERNDVVDDCLTVKIGNAKQHLGLKIDKSDNTIVGGEQTFFAALGANIG